LELAGLPQDGLSSQLPLSLTRNNQKCSFELRLTQEDILPRQLATSHSMTWLTQALVDFLTAPPCYISQSSPPSSPSYNHRHSGSHANTVLPTNTTLAASSYGPRRRENGNREVIPMTMWKKSETVVRNDRNGKELKLPSAHLSVGCSYHSRESSGDSTDSDTSISPTENTVNID
jgi:hypothetical protein